MEQKKNNLKQENLSSKSVKKSPSGPSKLFFGDRCRLPLQKKKQNNDRYTNLSTSNIQIPEIDYKNPSKLFFEEILNACLISSESVLASIKMILQVTEQSQTFLKKLENSYLSGTWIIQNNIG